MNAIDGVVSRYRWKGALEEDTETLLVCKTDAAHVPAVIEALKELHPYDVPELLSLPVESGAADYLAWVSAETGPPDAS